MYIYLMTKAKDYANTYNIDTWIKKTYRIHGGEVQVKHGKEWVSVREHILNGSTLFLVAI